MPFWWAILAAVTPAPDDDPPEDIVAEELAALSGKKPRNAERLALLEAREQRLAAELADARGRGATPAVVQDIARELRDTSTELEELRFRRRSLN